MGGLFGQACWQESVEGFGAGGIYSLFEDVPTPMLVIINSLRPERKKAFLAS